MTSIIGGLPGFGTTAPNRIQTGQTKYEIGIYNENCLVAIFKTQTEFALQVIRSEASRAQKKLEKLFPDKKYEIRELF